MQDKNKLLPLGKKVRKERKNMGKWSYIKFRLKFGKHLSLKLNDALLAFKLFESSNKPDIFCNFDAVIEVVLKLHLNYL